MTEIKREKITIDATDQTLGRLATHVANLLRGKNKPSFAPHKDEGARVIIINAKNIKLTGKKIDQKIYRHHSHHPGGLKEIPLRRKEAEKPGSIIESAVWGMLPTNKLRRVMIQRLTIKQ